MSIYLILNADDLGYCKDRDDGIIELANQIKLSASVLVNGKSFEQVIKRGKETRLEVGWHLNLTEGKPISDENTVKSLCVNGEFRGKFGFREAFDRGEIDKEEMLRELNAQVSLFKDRFGNYPHHFDGHQHVHIYRNIPEIIAPLLLQYGIMSTRLCLEPLTSAEAFSHVSDFQRNFYLDIIKDSVNAEVIFRNFGILTTRYFMGLSLMGKNMTLSRFQNTIEPIIERYQTSSFPVYIEMMVHCGYPSKQCEDDEFSKSLDRIHELRFLQSSEFLSYINSKSLKLSSWSSLRSSIINIVFISPLLKSTGNETTASRIINGIKRFHHVTLVDSSSNPSTEFLNNFDIILCLHAFRSGQYVLNAIKPVITILGGTDCYKEWHNDDTLKVTKSVLDLSTAIIAFNVEMINSINSWYYVDPVKCKVIQPSNVIKTKLTTNFSLRRNLKLSLKHGNDFVMLLVAGIRPVKDVIFLVDHVIEWHNRNPTIYLVIMGPILDRIYFDDLILKIHGSNAVKYHQEVSQDELLASIIGLI